MLSFDDAFELFYYVQQLSVIFFHFSFSMRKFQQVRADLTVNGKIAASLIGGDSR